MLSMRSLMLAVAAIVSLSQLVLCYQLSLDVQSPAEIATRSTAHPHSAGTDTRANHQDADIFNAVSHEIADTSSRSRVFGREVFPGGAHLGRYTLRVGSPRAGGIIDARRLDRLKKLRDLYAKLSNNRNPVGSEHSKFSDNSISRGSEHGSGHSRFSDNHNPRGSEHPSTARPTSRITSSNRFRDRAKFTGGNHYAGRIPSAHRPAGEISDGDRSVDGQSSNTHYAANKDPINSRATNETPSFDRPADVNSRNERVRNRVPALSYPRSRTQTALRRSFTDAEPSRLNTTRRSGYLKEKSLLSYERRCTSGVLCGGTQSPRERTGILDRNNRNRENARKSNFQYHKRRVDIKHVAPVMSTAEYFSHNAKN